MRTEVSPEDIIKISAQQFRIVKDTVPSTTPFMDGEISIEIPGFSSVSIRKGDISSLLFLPKESGSCFGETEGIGFITCKVVK